MVINSFRLRKAKAHHLLHPCWSIWTWHSEYRSLLDSAMDAGEFLYQETCGLWVYTIITWLQSRNNG